MTESVDELYEQLLDQTVETYESSEMDLFDVLYDLTQYIDTTELEDTWNKIVFLLLKRNIETTENIEDIKMGDIYVAGDAIDIHKEIEKQVYKLAQEKELIE